MSKVSRYRQMQCVLLDVQAFFQIYWDIINPLGLVDSLSDIRKRVDDALGNPSIADAHRIRKAAKKGATEADG